MAVDDSYQAS